MASTIMFRAPVGIPPASRNARYPFTRNALLAPLLRPASPLLVAHASTNNREPATAAPAPSSRKLALLGAVAELCEIQGATSKFESFAGRSAMLGVIVALVVELLTEESLLPLQDASVLAAYVGLALACVLAAAAAAAFQAASKLQRGDVPLLLEPVLTSLTAVKRSASSITASLAGDRLQSLDSAVDDVMEHAFPRERMDQLVDASEDL